MDKIPSQSLSKSLLLATPLFFIVLAVLNSSNQLSYLFILKFINNMGGQADIMFLPTTQPQSKNPNLQADMRFKDVGALPEQYGRMEGGNIPLVNITQVQKWGQGQYLVRGVAPRWLIPGNSGNIDVLMLFLKQDHEKSIGIGESANLQTLKPQEVGISSEISMALGISPGDHIKITMKISNILKGGKLIEKNQQNSSQDQYIPDKAQISPSEVAKQLHKRLNLSQYGIRQQDVIKVVNQTYNNEVDLEYTVAQEFYPQGLYPSVLHNVIVFGYGELEKVMAGFIVGEVKKGTFDPLVPQEYKKFWKSIRDSKFLQDRIGESLNRFTSEMCLFSVISLQRRTQIYHPSQPLDSEFSLLIQSAPSNVQIISIYPIFHDALFMKFFFQSVIQIFTFVACLIFYYTMSLVMKQLYEEKQIEVGLWRTLGAGGARMVGKGKDDNIELEVEIKVECVRDLKKKSNWIRGPVIMRLREKTSYAWHILTKVGYLYYWLVSCLLSIGLYLGIKYVIFWIVCDVLRFPMISQSWSSPLAIFISVFLFIQSLALTHINSIYKNPLVETIKPVKRTFDLVKIRLINLSTFGISSDTLLIAIMLVYYGVTAYYFIPFSILDNNPDLQIYLFNSIFVFMIFGAVLLLSVLQSRIQILLLRIVFKISKRFSKMKIIMLKNIRAKQYKNIKVSVIISLTFAFLLFFSTGIKIEARIIQSFVQRSLGADLVMENYQRNTFDKQKVDAYLNGKGLEHSWLSRDLNRQGVTFTLQNPCLLGSHNTQFQVISPQYLNSTFQQYYVPSQYYDSPNITYSPLSETGVLNGFNGIYTFQGGSVGFYNASDTNTISDPHNLTVRLFPTSSPLISLARQQQIINMVLSQKTHEQLGGKVGSLYKLKVKNSTNGKSFYTRAKTVHVFKAGPGFDILLRNAFISQQQASYLYGVLGAQSNAVKQSEKLFIKSKGEDSLNGIGEAIVAMSPQHTQLFDMKFITQSFYLLTHYLDLFVIMITVIMAVLAIVFLSVYTVSKCKDEAQMYKILRAVGLKVRDIRHMVFLEIFIRVLVSIINGILLGIVFSLGFSMQIEEFLMIRNPPLDLNVILIIAGVLIVVFALVVQVSTRYLAKRTVLETTKR